MIAIILSKYKDSGYQQISITSGGGPGSQGFSAYGTKELSVIEFINDLEQELSDEDWEVIHEDTPKSITTGVKEKLMFWK